ncbi:unnamed protein product [Adineta steineri]|uniref:Uncharacterized protein n=1 Tax=Adineta steineri TaxID=433720 RepID=A0A813TP94_9BILA|nr:unnamed protein product [Adineta steineri]CAF0815414.1 unnamed protein product [Adineta steineri]
MDTFNTTVVDCEYCVNRHYSNGTTSETRYDCIQLTNTYKTISQRCQGFSNTTDIGYGTCLPYPYELLNTSVLCICATDKCNTDLASCNKSVTNQIQSNSAPSVLPSIIPTLSTPISCVDTLNQVNISTGSYYNCMQYGSSYVNLTKCHEYIVNNTVLCWYYGVEAYSEPIPLTKDIYTLPTVDLIHTIYQYIRYNNYTYFSNESSSFFYISSRETSANATAMNTCICAQNNCNSNLITCLTATKSIETQNNSTNATQTTASLTQMNSPDDNTSLDILFSKLNIPLNCLDNSHIRQHYLEEYSAKYSKAKYLLSNARKKQRKIIISYYKEKEKQDNIDELQTIKQSLLEENEKIKRFKEALKDKLLVYQQRIQFLKDAEFWSAFEIQQLQNNTNELCQVNTENHPSLPDLPAANDSLDLLHGHEHTKYPDNFLDDSSLNNTDDHDDSKPSYHDSFLIKDHRCIDNILKSRKQSHMKVS